MAATEERGLVVAPHNALQVADADVLATADLLIKHRGVGVFPQDMTPQQAGQLARLACAYGLDPFAGELVLYQSRPYVTIDGRTRIANSHPAFAGMECVPATEDERKAFRCGEEEHLWKATVWRTDRRVPAVAYGRASSRDGSPVSARWGQEMAQKRAKHRAYRDAFPMPIPGAEESPHDGGAAMLIDDGPPTPVVIDSQARRYEVETDLEQELTNPIREDQVKALHTLVGKMKWTADDYRDMLQHTYGVESSKDLMEGQAASLLEMLHTLEEEQTGDAFITRVREMIAAGGVPARDLAYPSDEVAPRYAGAEEQPTMSDAPEQERHGVTAAQVDEIRRLAPDWADGADWDSMTQESADIILVSLRDKRGNKA